jgi:alpha-beta hydrolase superfamily lysophospholipase
MEKEFLLKRCGMSIPVKVTTPDFGDIRRVVLGVHGLGGSTEDAIQQAMAEEMEMFYSATVRFDLPAHGKNEQTELLLDSCLDTLYAAACYAKESFPEVEDLCIFASGFGAYLTLLSLQDLLELPGRIRLVVQTPSVLMHQTILSMKKLTPETLRVMDRVNFAAPRPFDLTYHFYNQLRQNIALTTYPIPMLILQGEEDDYIRSDDIQQFHRINEDAKLVTIPGTSHRFLEEGAWDMVLDLTRDWFEYEQVLLTDWD